MSGRSRILGIDPGSRRLGWAILEQDGWTLRALGAGVLALAERDPLEARLVVVHDALVELLEKYGPTVLSVEDVFGGRYPQAALKLAHVRGVILLVAAQHGLALHAYPPALVKRTVAGRGAADKAQVARLVAAALRLKVPPPADAADALAIAMTHASRMRIST